MKITKSQLKQIVKEEITNLRHGSLTESIGVDTKESLDAAVKAAYEEIATTVAGAVESGAWKPMEDEHRWIAGEISRMVTEQLDELEEEVEVEIPEKEIVYLKTPKGSTLPKYNRDRPEETAFGLGGVNPRTGKVRVK